MRDSQYKSCAVQNQFTAYLIAAIRNYKRTYLRRISTALRTELPMEGHSEVMELCEDTDFFCGLPLMQRLENERLFAAMQGLSERERYIFLSRVRSYVLTACCVFRYRLYGPPCRACRSDPPE